MYFFLSRLTELDTKMEGKRHPAVWQRAGDCEECCEVLKEMDQMKE